MTKSGLFLISILTLTASCNTGQNQDHGAITNVGTDTVSDIISGRNEGQSKEIICDTVYSNKDYKIALKTFELVKRGDTILNALFSISKLTKGGYEQFFSDSLFTTAQQVLFEDFNRDKVKDILVQNESDVRSNWTYNLYLIDTSKNEVRKVKGFNVIKNPRYLPEYDLIDNEVMSGRDWTAFYKIRGDSILSFEEEEYIVYWGADENGHPKNSEDLYKRNLNKVISKIKSNQ